MKTKKLVSLGLAAVMSLSLAVPAFAEDTNMQTVFEATYSKPDISVVVPQTGTVALNPLGLDVELSDTDATQTIKGLQIVTTPTTIVNQSKMKLDVNATVTTTVGGALKLTTSEQALVGTSDKQPEEEGYVAPKTDTSVFAFFQMKASAEANADDEAKINKEAAAWTYDYTETITTNAEGTTTVTPETDGCLILGTKPVSSSAPLVTLEAGDGSASKVGGVAQMRICGKMVQSPKSAWADTDTLQATVVFTFTPSTAP